MPTVGMRRKVEEEERPEPERMSSSAATPVEKSGGCGPLLLGLLAEPLLEDDLRPAGRLVRE